MTTGMKSLNDLYAGRYLGRYELLMPVAQGGMAAVWAARLRGTRGFQKIVAIKTILPTLSDDARFEQMFLDEAALASRVRHPNVVQVLDLGEEDGLLYQVMEWIDGEPLSTFLRDSPAGKGLPYATAAKIMIGVCEGLHAAHEMRDDSDTAVGLVHRDVSPQNILVTRDGVPKVVDFGVAKASTLSSARTTAGTFKGKPAYMAPEQIQGGEVDRRADIFALGVMLYVLTTGFHPFRGENDLATLHRICSNYVPKSPDVLHDDYPAELQRVVLKALEKDKEKRFSSAAALARAIEQAVPGVQAIGHAEIAAFMKTLLASKLEARATSLKKALAEADARAAKSDSIKPTTLPGTGPGPNSRRLAEAAGALPPEVTAPPGSSPLLTPTAVKAVTQTETLSGSEAVLTPGSGSGRTGLWFTLGAAAVVTIVVAAGLSVVMYVKKGASAAALAPTSSQTLASPPTATPDQGSSSQASSEPAPASTDAGPAIAAESLPAVATQPPGTWPPRPRDKSKPEPDADNPYGPEPTAGDPAPPATTPATQPTPTQPTTPTQPPGQGTVPTIRDPGF